MTDVNNTRFHLALGKDDWETFESAEHPDWVYDTKREFVTLRPQPFRFPDYSTVTPMATELRRGTGRDKYGNWYWLSEDRRSVIVRWSLARQAEHYWSPMDNTKTDEPTTSVAPPLFAPKVPAPPPPDEPLSGLAVTTEHYLVVGSPTRGELLVIDLHTGGAPMRLPLPAPSSDDDTDGPHRFDISPMPDGGIVLLDTRARCIWVYDQSLHPVPYATPQPTPALFQPKEGDERQDAPTATPDPLVLPLEVVRPTAVTPIADCGLLVLDTPIFDDDDPNARSTLHFFPNGATTPSDRVALAFDTMTDAFEVDINIRAHDIAFLTTPPADDSDEASPCTNFVDSSCADGEYLGEVYVVRHDGNQAFALGLCRNPADDTICLNLKPDYYPLRNYGARALVAVPDEGLVYFDHRSEDELTQWLPLTVLPRRRYADYAELFSEPMDGGELDCVWHRLCIDACIPPETSVTVYSRASNDAALLTQQVWQAEPTPYLRGVDAEIPYYSLWGDAEQHTEHTGTWETLFQGARGQYMQVKLVLKGNRRATPQIRALRAHYPRFSYLREYLPEVYQRDETSAHFLDRYLANTEGMFTRMEGLIAQAQVFFGSRSVPADAVTWLAGWIGLVYDPTFTDYQRRLLLDNALYFYSRRGTRLGIIQVVWVALAPQSETLIFTDQENPLCAPVRLIELFETAFYSIEALGGTTDEPLTTTAEDLAHRFVVLIDAEISDDKLEMVRRLVDMQKPAHTDFTVRRFWNMFRVGSSRLGIDTVLDRSTRLVPLTIGQTGLGEGTLGSSYPDDVTNGIVIRN